MRKKILTGFIMDGRAGGIDRYLLNMREALIDEDIQMDFLTNEIDEDLKKQLQSFHSNIYEIPRLTRPFRQYRRVKELIQKQGYNVVYLNISTAMDCVAAIAAKKAGVPNIIIHSHSSGNDCEGYVKRSIYNVLHKICRRFLYRAGTKFLACSKKAGEWMFPKTIVESSQFDIIYNAIASEQYAYDEDKRMRVRDEMHVREKFVIGHVGNFCYQKNHTFLLRVFQEIYKTDQTSVLWLAGDGRLFQKIREQAKSLGIEDAVYFLGRRSDVDCLMQAMDAFLLPSNFEGLGIVAVEAEYAGLPCFMSDVIPEEVIITQECYFLSLDEEPKRWAEEIMKVRNKERHAGMFKKEAKLYQLEYQKKQYMNIWI